MSKLKAMQSLCEMYNCFLNITEELFTDMPDLPETTQLEIAKCIGNNMIKYKNLTYEVYNYIKEDGRR